MEAHSGEERQADLILLNCKIFTAEVPQPYVQAVAIGEERILGAGPNSDSPRLRTPPAPSSKKSYSPMPLRSTD